MTRFSARLLPRLASACTTLVVLALVAGGAPALAQYVVTPQQGVPYPALTNALPVPLTAPGTNDPKDRGRATLPLGFQLPFYGRSYSQLTVTANGVAFLEPSTAANLTSDFPTNVAIPSGAEPNGVLALLWDDLVGSNATSAMRQQQLTGPNGAGLAVEWRDWNRAFGQFSLTFQVRVWENGVLEFFYGPLTGSAATPMTATVGIEAPNGTVGVAGLVGCTNDCAIASFDPSASGTPISYLRFGPPAGVDLQATALRVESIVANGASLDITTTLALRNFGTQASGPFTYRLLLSQDTVVDAADVVLTPTPRGPLTLAALTTTSSTVTSSVPAPSSGAWYVLAQVDEPNAVVETNEFNNVAASSVPYSSAVDLVAQAVLPPPLAGPGDPVSIDVQFANLGFTAAGPVNVKLWVSLDTTISPDDRLLTSLTIPVAGGQQVQRTVTFTMPSGVRADDYSVMLQVDDGPAVGAVVEVSDANNVVYSVTKLQVRQADLVVSDVRVRQPQLPFDETPVAWFGEPVRLEAFVSNAGGATASNVRVAFYLSDNETLNAITDPFVGELTGLTFAPGQSAWVTLPAAPVPTRSTNNVLLTRQDYFFFGAAIAPGLVELNAQNNALKSAPTLVRSPAPNLVALSARAPFKLGAGEVVGVSRTLANDGNRPSPLAKYRYYLSANDIITAEDTPLTIVTPTGEVREGSVTLALGARDSAVELVRLPAGVATASWYVGVLVDPDNLIDETREDDNGLASTVSEVVAQAIGLATPSLPDALVGQPYLVQLAGAGAAGPFTFSLANPAELPAGLTLTSQGLLSGVPLLAGASGVTFVVEAGGARGVARRNLRVAATTAGLALTTTSLPAPARQYAYEAQLGAAGGVAPYRFAVVAGQLPAGLTLAASGRFGGQTAVALGVTSNFAVRVTDAIGNVDQRAFSLTVVDAAPFRISTAVLPGAAVGLDYLQDVLAVNPSGAPVSRPVRWAVIGGALPEGLALEASTTERVVVSGRATRPGLFSVTIEAVDGQGRADSATYVLDVAAGQVTMLGELPATVAPGAKLATVLSLDPEQPGAQFFVRDGQLPPGVTLAADGTLAGEVPSDAALLTYNFSLGAGPSRDQLVALRAFAVTVTNEAPRKTGCAASGLEPLVLLGLLWLRRRRR